MNDILRQDKLGSDPEAEPEDLNEGDDADADAKPEQASDGGEEVNPKNLSPDYKKIKPISTFLNYSSQSPMS